MIPWIKVFKLHFKRRRKKIIQRQTAAIVKRKTIIQIGGIESSEFFTTTNAKPQIIVTNKSPKDARSVTVFLFMFLL